MPKGWPCDGGGNGSERRVKSQRCVVNDLAYCLPVVVAISLTEAKDHRQAHKGVNDQLAPPQFDPSPEMLVP
jgi:hypothetical protein